MIPKKIHVLWIGNKPIPSVWKDRPETWKKKNPNYEYKFWDNESIREVDDSDFLSLIDEGVNPTHLSDYFRYKILKIHGGFYFDVDFECVTPIEEWPFNLDSSTLQFFGVSYCNVVQAGIIGSCLNSDVGNRMLEVCTKEMLRHGHVFGPDILNKELQSIITKPECTQEGSYKFMNNLKEYRIVNYDVWRFFPTWHGLGREVKEHLGKSILTMDEGEYSCWYPDRINPIELDEMSMQK